MFNDNCRRIENSSGAKIGSEMKTPPHTIVSLALAAARCGLPGLLVAASGPVELRGKWVLENLLGTPPPEPPPNIPALEEERDGKPVSLRDAMAQHRENPACSVSVSYTHLTLPTNREV